MISMVLEILNLNVSQKARKGEKEKEGERAREFERFQRKWTNNANWVLALITFYITHSEWLPYILSLVKKNWKLNWFKPHTNSKHVTTIYVCLIKRKYPKNNLFLFLTCFITQQCVNESAKHRRLFCLNDISSSGKKCVKGGKW